MSKWDLSKQSFDPQRGMVFVRGQGSFTGANETLNNEPSQLPQFLPRTQWPADAAAGAQHRPSGKYPPPDWPRDDVNVTAQQLAARVSVDSGYPQLTPMPPFLHANSAQSGRPIYNGSIWQDHVAILHGLLKHTLRDSEKAHKPSRWLDENEIMELLTCLSYGMNQSVAVLEPWMISGPPTSHGQSYKSFQQSPVPEFNNREMKDGCYKPLSLLDPATFKRETRRKMLGRRWLVVPINQFNSHWIMTLFDRQKGQLYIFDSAHFSRSPRIEATVHLWARFWHDLDMPWHFQYFVPSITPQPFGWECGLISVHWIWMILRNRVGGTQMLASDSTIPIEDFTLLDQTFPGIAHEDSSLHIPDWVPLNCRAGKSGLGAVIHHTKVMICNELGLKDDSELTGQDGKAREKEVCEKPWERLKQYIDSSGRVPVSNFFTGNGGPQFSLPRTSKGLPYNADSNQHRVHCPIDGNSGFIEFDPQELAAEPTQNIENISYPIPIKVESGSSTPAPPANNNQRQPQPIANDQSGLWVRGIQPIDEFQTDNYYPIELDLADARHPGRVIPPLTVYITDWCHGAGQNGRVFTQSVMHASFPNPPGGNVPRTLIVLPIEQALQPGAAGGDDGGDDDPGQQTQSSSQQESENEIVMGNTPEADSSIIPRVAQSSFASQAHPGGNTQGASAGGTKRPRESGDEGEQGTSGGNPHQPKRPRQGPTND